VINEVLREVPQSFLCPLSKTVMTDPVLLVASGHTYERAALARHFSICRYEERMRVSSGGIRA
jgi:hypothetical protein